MRGTKKRWIAIVLFVCLTLCFASAAQASSSLLRLGSRGEEVKKLQQILIENGFLEGNADGIFGPMTESALIKFQMFVGIEPDGIAGPITLALIQEMQLEGELLQEEAVQVEEAEEESVEMEIIADTAEQINSRAAVSDRGAKDGNLASILIDFALKYLGKPYVYGSAGPNAFDCSGFTTYVYRHFGISLPRSAKDQGYGEYAPKVAREDLKPGDLVFFNTNAKDGDLSDHAGIYIGDGKFIHASSSKTNGRKVIISTMDSGYYARVFSWGRRVLK